MEHNTLVKYGFKEGVQQPVFDPESETQYGSQYKSIHPKFDLEPTHRNKKRKNVNDDNPTKSKRKRPDINLTNSGESDGLPSADTSASIHQNKKRKKSKDKNPKKSKHGRANDNMGLPTTMTTSTSTEKTKFDTETGVKVHGLDCNPPPHGCIWSAADWSCAYDSFFMVFFYIHHSSTEFWINSWTNFSPLTSILHKYFSSLSSEYKQGQRPKFNQYRDQIRDILSERQPTTFPRHGAAAIDVSDIFEQLNRDSEHGRTMSIRRTCSNCNQTFPIVSLHLPTTIHPAMLPCSTNHPISMKASFTIQDWVNTIIDEAAKDEHSNIHRTVCSSAHQNTDISFEPSPYLHFDVPSDGPYSVFPSMTLTLTSGNTANSSFYQLRGIIYHGDLHFTARLITMDHITWNYDGQRNTGIPLEDDSVADDVSKLTTLHGRRAYIYIYQHITHQPD